VTSGAVIGPYRLEAYSTLLGRRRQELVSVSPHEFVEVGSGTFWASPARLVM